MVALHCSKQDHYDHCGFQNTANTVLCEPIIMRLSGSLVFKKMSKQLT